MLKHRSPKTPHNTGPKRRIINGGRVEGVHHGGLPLRGGLDFGQSIVRVGAEGNGHVTSELTLANELHGTRISARGMNDEQLVRALGLEIRLAPDSDSIESKRAGVYIEELSDRRVPFGDVIKVIFGAISTPPEGKVFSSPERER